MKKAIILHGTGSTPQSYWHPYLKEKLELKDFIVEVPQLPDTNNPDIKKNLPFVLENLEFTDETILIGHSSGCPLILSILEHIDIKIKKAILVAGFCDTLNSPSLQENYDFEKIKLQCDEFIFINSDNDPWGCDDIQGRKLLDNLGGDLIIRKGEGHMGSTSFNQEYKEFPLLLKLI